MTEKYLFGFLPIVMAARSFDVTEGQAIKGLTSVALVCIAAFLSKPMVDRNWTPIDDNEGCSRKSLPKKLSLLMLLSLLSAIVNYPSLLKCKDRVQMVFVLGLEVMTIWRRRRRPWFLFETAFKMTAFKDWPLKKESETRTGWASVVDEHWPSLRQSHES